MNDIEQFTEFINGRLDGDSEQVFFDSLAADGNLRAEFRIFVAISGSIQKNRKSFAPTAALTSSVFAAAGIALPEISANPVTSAAKAGFFGSKAFTVLTTSLITILLSSSVYYILNESKGISNNSNIAANSLFTNKVPAIRSIELYNKANNSTEKENVVKTIIKYIYVNNNPTNRTEPELPLQQAGIEKYKEILNLSNINYNSESINNPAILTKPRNTTTDYMLNSNIGEPVNLEAEIGNNFAWNLPGAKIAPDKYSPFQNLSVSLMYKIENNLKAGIEVNQETFYTEYNGSEQDGSKYIIRQQPNFTTISASLRYMPIEIKGLSPYVQIGLGGNKGGFVVKPSVGLEYNAYPDLSFILGAEYNQFWFSHHRNWTSTSKIDLKYGISFKF